MVKKGKSGKKKQNKEDKKDSLPEVDKEYYEIQITDLNKRLTRLKSVCAELETENEELKKKYKILDQDRGDVIAYLKRSLTQKQDEIIDLTNRLDALQKEKKNDISKFEVKIQEMERKYDEMSNMLTSEITLLNGKLNSLEEFKIQKDSMVNKYVDLEKKLKTEVERHLDEEKLMENKNLIYKENLRSEIEERLLNLSINIQNDVQYRLAETTHNVVSENIALNNELNLIITSWQKLFNQNESLRCKIKTLTNEIDVSFSIKDDLLTKHILQKEIIDRLVIKHEEFLGRFDKLKYTRLHNTILRKKLKNNDKQTTETVNKYRHVVKLCHALKVHSIEIKLAFDKLKHHNHKLEERIKEAVMIIKDVIGLGKRRQREPFSITEQEEYNTRSSLLNTLLKLFDDVNIFLTGEVSTPPDSHESILADEWKISIMSERILPCPSEPSFQEQSF